MPISVKISQQLTDDLYAAVGEFSFTDGTGASVSGPASVLLRKVDEGYELALDEAVYPSMLDGRIPEEYFHAPVAAPNKRGIITFSKFHITFKKIAHGTKYR